MRTSTLIASLLVSFVIPLTAWGDWASDMFKDTSHNFGMVAHGADTHFSFVFTNKYEEDVVIESVRSTCRCTQPSFKPMVIKTWQQGQVDIKLDTQNFFGRKDATVTVRFSRPYPAEVQLHSFCLIRSDVYVEPGNIAFGTVPAGEPRQQTFRVNYAGRTYWQSWQITDIQSESPFYRAVKKEIQRNYNYVTYDITLTLKEDAPAGYLNDYIDIISNDPNPSNQHCPIPVSGLIMPSVTVKPSPISFGVIPGGESVTKTVVITGQKPFAVKGVNTTDTRISAQLSPTVKTVHIIPVTITNNAAAGKFEGNLSFNITSQTAPVNLPYSGETLPTAKPTAPPIPDKSVPATEINSADDVLEETVVETPAETQPPKELTPAQKFFPPKKESQAKIQPAYKAKTNAPKTNEVTETPETTAVPEATVPTNPAAPDAPITKPTTTNALPSPGGFKAPIPPAQSKASNKTVPANTETDATTNADSDVPEPVELDAPEISEDDAVPAADSADPSEQPAPLEEIELPLADPVEE